MDHKLFPDRSKFLYSLGKSCELLQVVPAQLHLLMQKTGVSFVLVVDDTGFLSADDLLACAKLAGEIRDEIADAQQTVEVARGGVN